MTIGTKIFIEDHIDLIEDLNFEKIYSDNYVFNRSELTQMLLSVDIDPLKYLNYVPNNYLCMSDIDSFIVPEHIRKIGTNAFWRCHDLQKIKFSSALERIEEEAFCECYTLENINLPENLTYIGADAFAETGLKHVVIPNFVPRLPSHCFEECKQLETVKIGNSVTDIGVGCFGNCEKLRYVQLPEGLLKISDCAFKGCESLTELYIPESVTNIHPNAFLRVESNLKILCKENSEAHKYAELSRIDFELI